MSMSKITLIGLYNYDNSLFDLLNLPDGIEKDLFINNLLLSRGEFEVIYSNLDFTKSMIGVWGHKWQHTFSRWIKALSVEYNPLENYDRIENFTDVINGSSENIGQSDTMRSSFDSGSYQPYERVNNSIDNTTKSTNTRTARMHGNIGVTTSQQMLQSELDVAAWNLYSQMADIFAQEFLIPVYE